jgi:Ni,Fe-hydrogenase I small subunit
VNITRRQFLQYCAASAAALGLSQTDLLRLEKALATPQQPGAPMSPSVIWLTGQACSGCPVSLLNRVNKYAGNPYYDADMINAVYPGSGLTPPGALGNDAAGLPLQVVNDAADLLVGDAVRALTGISRGNLWSDDLGGVLPGSLLDAYIGPFPKGFITLEWNTTVMAAAGDIPTAHLKNIRNGGGLLGAYVVVVDGAIPAGNKNYCWVFDNNDGAGNTIIPSIGLNYPVSVNEALEWLATGAGCLGIVSQGTCAAFGGIPGGLGNKTGAMGVKDYLASSTNPTVAAAANKVINVPGCPPHPDWTVYPVAYLLAISTPSNIVLPPLDQYRRPRAVFSGSDGSDTTPFCFDCANKPTQGTPQAAQELGEAGCLGALGCKGPYTVGDCPIRGKNTSDDGYSMNWCVGASGNSGVDGAPTTYHVGEARHPCQGCIMPQFPDWTELVSESTTGQYTSKKIKGFYNG